MCMVWGHRSRSWPLSFLRRSLWLGRWLAGQQKLGKRSRLPCTTGTWVPIPRFTESLPISLRLSVLIYTASVHSFIHSLNIHWVPSSVWSSNTQLWTRQTVASALSWIPVRGTPMQSSVKCGCWNNTPWVTMPALSSNASLTGPLDKHFPLSPLHTTFLIFLMTCMSKG